MSATTTSPARKRPGAISVPTFGPCIVTVTVACTQAPAISPVEAFTPEGRSTATTGLPVALIASIVRAASSRGSPVEAGAEERVDDHVGLDDRRVLGRARDLRRRLEHLERDPAVAAVRAAAADGHEPNRVREAAHRLLGDRPPARAISSSTSWPASARFISSAV